MELSVIYKNGAFVVKTRDKFFTPPNLKGWKHNDRDGWFTKDLKSAALLRDYADDRVKNILDRAFIQFTPWKGALTIPKGLKTLPHQPGAALFSLSRNRSYQALSPGLGKTIVAALIAKSMNVRCLYLCPPFLTLNTLEEFQKWAPNLHTRILSNVDWIVPDVLIVPDSQITNPYVRSYIRMFSPKLFIGDEWHRYKTDTAQRSKAVFGFRDRRRKVKYVPGILDGKDLKKIVLMSGTPMPNRPIELFTTLSKCAREFIDFQSKNEYGLKYCEGFLTRNEWTNQAYGYDLTGCNKVEFKKLMKRLKTPIEIRKNGSFVTTSDKGFMLRLNKIILGLPKLSEEITILGDDMPRALKSMDADMLKKYSPKDLIKLSLKKKMGLSQDEEDIHLMTYRRLLGEFKVKPAAEYIRGVLEDTDDVVFIVAIHKDVIRLLKEEFKEYSPYVVTGDTPMKKRHQLVKEFQASDDRVFMGNLDAMGMGYTLTRCNRVFLIEFEYDPGSNRQVIDRVHRYTLEHEVSAEYLVYRNSLDRSTIETLLFKEKIIEYV